MSNQNIFNRRDFLAAMAAVSAVGLSACAAHSQRGSRLWSPDRISGRLPPRGEFVVRNAYIVTMDAKLGDIPNGDVHVRNGALVAGGPNLNAPSAEEIDGRNRIALPGFIDTHFHLWGSFARGIVADGDFDYFPVMSRIGPVMTPEDAYNSAKLGIAEAVSSGFTTGRITSLQAPTRTPICARCVIAVSARVSLTVIAEICSKSLRKRSTSMISPG
jgi:5-methylthioadenosine/S-adenosylhomocysteine deaminase